MFFFPTVFWEFDGILSVLFIICLRFYMVSYKINHGSSFVVLFVYHGASVEKVADLMRHRSKKKIFFAYMWTVIVSIVWSPTLILFLHFIASNATHTNLKLCTAITAKVTFNVK